MDTTNIDDDLTCKPLKTFEDIRNFLDNPPGWRSLCVGLTEHSKYVIKNSEINSQRKSLVPQVFCHIDSETKNVQRHESKLQPKTLLCHDMANGYHDDRFLDGTGNHDAYTFYNWATIDIFCYFSHHFITIPPLGWINVGHNHGVKVIGTVITEWKEGEQLWSEILESEASWRNFASSLVTIATTLKFDGWLLNVENPIAKPAVLLEFVQYLHQQLHQQLPAAVLIWYDSVTIDGRLAWQNGLNKNNRAFFDACDGIFTNYSWKEKHLAHSAAEAGERLLDVFVGIDVWGRNFLGGGKFNTQEAIQLAYEHGSSLAIFAPAWTHEAMDDEANKVTLFDNFTDYDRFLLRDRAFWNTIWPHLNTKLPSKLPFNTSFCRGQGKKRWLHGEVLCPVPWYNLRHMQYQPNSAIGPHGYLLALKEHVERFYKNFLFDDYSGEIKYRKSYNVDQLNTIETDVFLNTKNLLDDGIPEEEMSAEGEQTSKRKIKEVFVNLMKQKRFKKPVKTQDESDDSTKESAATSDKPTPTHPDIKLVHIPDELQCLEPYFEDSFIGGSCLKVNPSDLTDTEHKLARLFHCDFLCEESIIVCVVTKTCKGHEDQYLNMILTVASSQQELQVVLVGHDRTPDKEQTNSGEMSLYPLRSVSSHKFHEVQKYMLLEESRFYVPMENSYGWKVRYYVIKMAGARVTAINCRTAMPVGPVLLGHLGICARKTKLADEAF